MTATVEPALLPGSIEEHLTADVPVCSPDDTAASVRGLLLTRRFASVVDVAVCVDGGRRLVGLLPVERVLAAPDDTLVASLMDADPPVVAPGLDQEKAAWKAVRHGESSLAVVDSSGTFRGLVRPSRLLAVLLAEHDEDLAGLGGVLASTAGAAWLVRGYEAELTDDVRLAFFVPGVVYMADAVGTQTEALVIRGLSVGVGVRRVYRLESLTGLVVGLMLAAVTFPVVWLAFGAADLALVVSVALVAACSVATVVAMSLPWLTDRLGRDPALGSGPLATVVQDLLSLLIYFAVAVALVR